MKTLLKAALLTIGGVCVLAADTQAQQPYYPAYSLLPGYGRAGVYSTSRVPTPPYFALHPPVYYSYPVPRPYGYSPFAYPEYMKTPAFKINKQQNIRNPHVPKKAAEAVPTNQTTSTRGVMIINPFVRSDGALVTK